ncbi:MAG: GNAT family N-acetyltransferase [Rhodobacter sp.]|nr:GNAT family N-acetyltransferase [Rhodobacter sp.]
MIRPATKADLPAIRDLQIASWRRTYRGILSDSFLGDPLAEVLTQRWSASPGRNWLIDTAWDADALTGFVAIDRAHDGGPYIDNLHVAAKAQGRGLGRALMAHAAATLAAEDHRTLWLTVIRENTATRAFYRRQGGAEGPEQAERIYGQPVVSLPVRWSDLPALAGLGRVPIKGIHNAIWF